MQVEIRSNILGDIAKIRKGVVFKEYATVVDELLQNSQRAKAKHVEVIFNDNEMTVIDDGVGCVDPQAIFEKNTTAWGNEDEAFGEGFFSVFLLADKLEVESCDWKLELDVLKMFETGNLTIDVSKNVAYRGGFLVRLIGERVEEHWWSLRKEAQELGEIAPYELTLNGVSVPKESILEIDAPFSRLYRNDIYEAVFVPSRGFSTINTFYENRPVKTHYGGAISGKLHFNKGMITLKAPDRKEFIWDDKRNAFTEQLQVDATLMYRDFVKQASDSEIDMYADSIEEYLTVDEYLNLLSVDESLFDFLRFSNEGLEDTLMDDLDAEQMKNAAEMFRQLFELQAGSEMSSGKRGPRLIDVVAKDKKLSWVRASEVDSLKLEIRSAEYYGFRVIVARNKLYERAFEHLYVMHVSSLKEDVEKHHLKEKVGAQTQKEERLLALLQKVEEHFDLAPGTIELANLELIMSYSVEGEEIETERKQVRGVCDGVNGKIYLDRTLIDWASYRAQKPNHPTVTTHDYKILMQVMQTLSHELAHLLFRTEDNTKEHNDAENQIYSEIVRLF